MLFVAFSSSPRELQLEPFHVAKMAKKKKKTGTLSEPLSSWTVADKKTTVRWLGLTSRALLENCVSPENHEQPQSRWKHSGFSSSNVSLSHLHFGSAEQSKTRFSASPLACCFDQYFRENEVGPRVAAIADPESVVRDKGHDVPITAASAPSLFKHEPVLSPMCSTFAGACQCVWGTGDERLTTSGRPHLTPACAVCGNNPRRR